MTQRSALATLMGGYFHQDVFDIYPDEFAAVDDFARSAPAYAATLPDEIADVLRRLPNEDALETYLAQLGCAIDSGDVTYREWLTQIADRVRSATAVSRR